MHLTFRQQAQTLQMHDRLQHGTQAVALTYGEPGLCAQYGGGIGQANATGFGVQSGFQKGVDSGQKGIPGRCTLG